MRSQNKKKIGGFTLAEILAALAMMAVVVPVAVQGVSIASRAGLLGQRKAAAARVASRVLNEMILTDQLQESSMNGSMEQGGVTYEWTLESEPWTNDAINLISVKVLYTVQDQQYEVRLSTLHDPNAGTTSTTDSSTASVRF